MKRSRAETKKIIDKSKFLHKLLYTFNVTLLGFNPGVLGSLGNDRSINFNGIEWSWLEPLLIELKERRENDCRSSNSALSV